MGQLSFLFIIIHGICMHMNKARLFIMMTVLGFHLIQKINLKNNIY